ncbi:5,6-dimethylbenzimidazole synthase [Cutibacterium sp. WCA-380-WT-3A]|uniref:5,6-dimethylbenzimidazole synthase n=1 Tax=Cutibacterium porci TaxID=2605781 RepID=A0A7K0J773_9ACTN|nr:5,6-dimethylbenzimidazole synthase [Cutibacterium porci]MSS45693.1 5,6-dimethylbenzimidazole synthase [Cutibacterium porci]
MTTTDENPSASQRWNRPIPRIGDTTSSATRAADPTGWSLGDQVQLGLDAAIDARRDIRRYRHDDVCEELINTILWAGHRAPSVGHSQPWRFIVVRDADIRDRAAVMADRERLRQADLLTPDRKSRLLDLQLEGIREAPVGIVVACDRRAPASGVLGRNTFTDADMWSCACAVENMWLTARAHGLGMGWVTLFQPTELAELLHLPDGVETLGWLCLGWPDERPPAPGLERRGWSRRVPLNDVTLYDRWPDTAQPKAPISALRQPLHSPDRRHVVAAHDDADQLLTPPGSLGLLDQTLDRVEAAHGADITSGTLVLVGADHPVAHLGVTAFDTSVTHDVMAASVAGTGLGVSTATAAGLSHLVVDAGVAQPVQGATSLRLPGKRGDLCHTDAMTPTDVEALLSEGRRIGAQAASNGLVCLGEVGVGNTTVATALACVLTGLDPEQAVGLGAGSDTAMVERKADVIKAALARTHATCDDPEHLLATLGGPEFAVLAGVCLGSAEAGSPVILDGLATSVAALIAATLSPGLHGWLVASHVSREHAHEAVLAELGLEALMELRMRAGEGVGACFGAQMILTGLHVRRTAARTR